MKDKILIIMFLGFIFIIMAVTMIMPQKDFSPAENRYLNKKPEFTVADVVNGEYEEQYKDYINDQFLLRDEFLKLSSTVRLLLGMRDINGVYVGEDGYLMEKHDKSEFESDNAKENVRYLSEFAKELTDKNIDYQVLLIPTSSEVLADKLPFSANPYKQKDFIDYVYDKVGDGHTIDALEILSQHADEYIYYKTDHHYTTLGAYYVYEKWAEAAKVSENDSSDFDIKQVTGEFYGTLDAKTHLAKSGDTIYLYTLKKEVKYEIQYNDSEYVSTDLYDMDALENRDKYSVFLGGNNEILEIKTECENGRKILIIKDSFAHSFIPFLINAFEQIDVIDLRYYNKSIWERINNSGYTDVLVLYSASGFATDNHIFKLAR